MYPYDFNPRLKGLNPEEVFVVMPFAPVYDPIYTELVEPALRAAGTTLTAISSSLSDEGRLGPLPDGLKLWSIFIPPRSYLVFSLAR